MNRYLEKTHGHHFAYSIAGLCAQGLSGPAIRPTFVVEHRETAFEIAQAAANYWGAPCTLVCHDGEHHPAFQPQDGAPALGMPEFPQHADLPLHVRQHILLSSDLSPEVLAQSHPDIKGIHPEVGAHHAALGHPLCTENQHHRNHVDRGHVGHVPRPHVRVPEVVAAHVRVADVVESEREPLDFVEELPARAKRAVSK